MPIAFEDVLRKDIASKHFAPVYLLFGDDSYLVNYYKDTLVKKSTDGDPFFNMQKFEGDIELQEVFDAVNQFPMMAERKSVLLYDFDFEHCAKSDFDRLLELISNANDTCVLIIAFDAIDFDSKRGAKEKKLLTAVEKVNGVCAEINHRTTGALVKMLSDAAKKRGCNLPDSSARYLIEISGSDLSTLKNELHKLCSFVGEGEITKEIISQIAVKSVDASVYEYIKQVLYGNVSQALTMLDDMFFMRIEPLAILSVISSNYIDIYRAYAANLAGVGNNTVAEDFKYPKNKLFLIERAAQSLRKMNGAKLRLSLDAIASADKSIKSFGTDPRVILEQLTIKLVYIMTKGESVD